MREAIDKVRQPFNVNRLAQVAALEALKHQDQVLERRRMVIEMREYLEDALDEHGSHGRCPARPTSSSSRSRA